MIKVIFAIFAILFLTITFAVNHIGKVKLQNKTLVEAYPARAEEYLENKYGEKFSIDPDYESRSSGPIPGDTDMPYIYKTQEKDGDRYMFWTYVYPMTDKDKNIKIIKDGYYWKTIEKETKEYIEDKMQGLLPKEYKILFLANPLTTFDATNLSLPMETYFSTLNNQVSIKIYIVAPPKVDMQEELLTEESVYPILNDFYKRNSKHIRIKFIYYRAVSEDDYKRTDIELFERSIYADLDEYKMIWDSVEWVGELRVKIE